MPKTKVRVTKLKISLPFQLGEIEIEQDERQQMAAWELYVEIATRIAVQPLGAEEGMLREALSSLYSIFATTREILRHAGPSIAKSPNSLGAISIEVLNKGLRPFLAKWHPLLLAYEQQRLPDKTSAEHEKQWPSADALRNELTHVQQQMSIYATALSQIAGVNT